MLTYEVQTYKYIYILYFYIFLDINETILVTLRKFKLHKESKA